jgi:hypothetical protein
MTTEAAPAAAALDDAVTAVEAELPTRVRLDHFADWPDDRVRLAAMALQLRRCREELPEWGDVISELARRRLGWTADEVSWLLLSVPDRDTYLGYFAGDARLPLGAAASLRPDDLRPLAPELKHFGGLFKRALAVSPIHRRWIARALDGLREAIGDVQALTDRLFGPQDEFGSAARARLGDRIELPGVIEFLAHCTEQDKVTPTKKWSAQCEALMAAEPVCGSVARDLIEVFAAHVESGHQVVHDDTETLLRGVVSAVGEDDGVWVTPALVALTTTAALKFAGTGDSPGSPRLTNTAIRVLASRDGDEPVATLARLAVTVKAHDVRKRLNGALADMAARRGLPPGELAELAIDRHELDADGRRVEKVGPYQAVISIDPLKAKVSLAFARDGEALKSTPAAVKEEHAEELKAVKALVKEIGSTVAAERTRVEQLLSASREWSRSDWVARYLEHPVTGFFGRRLIWESSVDGERWVSGLPQRTDDGWTLVRPDGEAVAGERVRLWHPIAHDVDEITAWRDHLMAGALGQPFKQAFREVYLLTPAERETASYSNRFAGHILRYRQANALMRERGWHSNYLGFFSGGHDGTATREFGEGQWRASFYHELVPSDGDDRDARFCSTDQVRFAQRQGTGWRDVAVVDVPPAVLSEAMRDVDLFVGVTSVAADPTWIDRGEDRFVDYWRTVAFGELTASAEVRRDALARLLPRTKIADRVELLDRFVRVRGTRATYRIHLGSGNIMIEPTDAYLCIVAARDRSAGLHLPFDEDAMLSVILSKAYLLAADDKITDETILRQLPR